MSDGMGREFAYLSSHANNRYFIPNWGIKYKDTIKKENYLIFPMQNMVMLCKVDSLVVNVIFHTSSKLYANVTSSKKCQVIKN